MIKKKAASRTRLQSYHILLGETTVTTVFYGVLDSLYRDHYMIIGHSYCSSLLWEIA
jgi:hypothetical protein